MQDNVMALRKDITTTHIMVQELLLYLNTHPDDKEALILFNSYVKKYNELKDEYNQNYGMLNAEGTTSPFPWQWINEPWPWEYDANFDF